MLNEVGVEIAYIACHFFADPRGQLNAGILCWNLKFGENQPLVFAVKDIHLEDQIAVRDKMARLINLAGQTEVIQQALRVGGRDGKLHFRPSRAVAAPLDG